MRRLKLALIIVLTFIFGAIFSTNGFAWGWRGGHRWGWGHRVHYISGWHGGHWFHGPYGGRFGWWWVVGPTWYFYSAPVYPYPPGDVTNVYYVEVPAGTAVASPSPSATAVPPPPANAAALTQPPPAMPPPTATPTPTQQPPKANKGQAYTYYCSATKSYYPNVTTCSSGWVATPVASPK